MRNSHKYNTGRLALSAIMMTTALSSPSWAQECSSYIGTTVELTTIEAAIEQFAGVTPRDEFETSEQYEARISAATADSGPFIIEKSLDRERLRYDADRQVFQIGRFAFDNENMPVDELWSYGGPFHESGNYRNRMYRIDTVIRVDDQITGSYEAQNSFGTSAEVVQIDRVYWGIFERFASGYDSADLIPTGDRNHLGEVPVPIDEARSFRDESRLAFVVSPQSPWQISFRENYPSRPTIQNPLEVTAVLNVLFADIRCALLLDGTGRSVAAFDTR